MSDGATVLRSQSNAFSEVSSPTGASASRSAKHLSVSAFSASNKGSAIVQIVIASPVRGPSSSLAGDNAGCIAAAVVWFKAYRIVDHGGSSSRNVGDAKLQ